MTTMASTRLWTIEEAAAHLGVPVRALVRAAAEAEATMENWE